MRITRHATIGAAAVLCGALAVAATASGTPFEIDIPGVTGDETEIPNVEPVASGGSVTIVSGRTPDGVTWSLSGFRSNQGLCLTLRSANAVGAGEGCGMTLDLQPVNYLVNAVPEARLTLVGGLVDPSATGVSVTFTNGQVARTGVVRAPVALGEDGAFFALAVPDSVGVVSAVVS